MSSDHQEVCDLLNALTPIVKASSASLGARTVVMAMAGIQKVVFTQTKWLILAYLLTHSQFNSDIEEVRDFIKVLTVKFTTANCDFKDVGVGNCIFGSTAILFYLHRLTDSLICLRYEENDKRTRGSARISRGSDK